MATSVLTRAPAVSGLRAAQMRATRVQHAFTAITFLGVYTVLALVLHPTLVLSRSIATGGDMGAHHYISQYLRDQLLPHGQIMGWAPGWFAGIPMLQFYFPLPYLAMAALSVVIPHQIAFKLVTVSGLVLMPWTSFLAFRILRIPDPAPQFAAVAALCFEFMTSFTIYGGNIASTMAGEFPFTLGLALVPLGLALLWRVVEEGTGRRRTAVLIAAVVLCHIVDIFSLVLAATFFLLRRPGGRRFRPALRWLWVFALAFCLTAFWSVPFLVYLPDTAQFGWTQLTDWHLMAPTEIRPWLLFSVIGLVVAIARRDRLGLLWAWSAGMMMLAFWALTVVTPQGALWDARLLPSLYFFDLMLGAYGAAVATVWLIGRLRGLVPFAPRRWYPVLLVGLIAIPVTSTWVNRSFIPFWTAYNYSGFQSKPGWPQAQALFRTISRLPPGRVMWEYSPAYQQYGTTRTFEDMPIFAHHPSMGGLLIESAVNGPFDYINQAETSQIASQAVPGIVYPSFNFTIGLEHLRLYGVRWFIAYTAATKQAATAAGLSVAARSGPFTIFDVGSGALVQIPRYRPVLWNPANWRSAALAWYADPSLMNSPLAFASASNPEASAAFAHPHSTSVTAIPREPLAHPGLITNAHMVGNEQLDFTTSQIGVPTIVKISYFPNWTAVGAHGPWMLSPGLMVVVPTRHHVQLVYGTTAVDEAGVALTVLGGLVLIVPSVMGVGAWIRRRRGGAAAGHRAP